MTDYRLGVWIKDFFREVEEVKEYVRKMGCRQDQVVLLHALRLTRGTLNKHVISRYVTHVHFQFFIVYIRTSLSRDKQPPYSVGLLLKFRTEHRLSRPKHFLVFLSPSRQMLGYYLNVGHDRFLSTSFRIHLSLSIVPFYAI
jgi:hypothetical protein